MANFCRSPVAQTILNKRFEGKYIFDSAGISPIIASNMDPRSHFFLEKNNYPRQIHTPKKLSLKIIKNSEIVFAVDHYVLAKLNHIFPRHRNKFKLLSYQHKEISLSDPYRFNENEYENVMKDIEFISLNINI